MNGLTKLASTATVLALSAWPAVASAQSGGQDLMSLDKDSLRGEIQTRYDAALARTQDPGTISADTNVFLWASQAKAQCGIALGFLKSGTKDPVSVGKCADAYNRMMNPTVAAAAPPPPPVLPCNRGPFIVFFDWDRSDITSEAATALDNAVAGYAGCGGAPVYIAGYTDRSGSDRYNKGLSDRRAEAVRSYFAQHGVQPGVMTTEGFGESNPRVPTADGVRELQNRRVEITVK